MTTLACCNDDVLVEILLRLPTKYLIRFQSVCRQWQYLISGDEFRRLHTLRRHKPPKPSLILHRPLSDLFYYIRPLSDDPKFVPLILPHDSTIVSSCNGLLLLQSKNLDEKCYVYNPGTKQSRKISLRQRDDYPHVLGLNLAFNPLVSPHYKIVCVRGTNRAPPNDHEIHRRCQIEIYDSVSREWKIWLESFTATYEDRFSNGVYWNNAIHWECSYAPPHLYLNTTNTSNDIGVVPHERNPFRETDNASCRLQESNGRLYYFDVTRQSVAVYELRQDYTEWSFKHGHWLDLDKPRRDHHWHHWYDLDEFTWRVRILSFVRGRGRATDILVIHVEGEILAYWFRGGSFQQLLDLTTQPNMDDALQYGDRNVYHFGETLALV